MKKILMICNTDGALYVFRKPLILHLVKSGNVVNTISGKSEYFKHLLNMGVNPRQIEFARHSVGIFENIAILWKLVQMIREIKPDVVHNFTHKPAIYGTLAARLAGTKIIVITITGLGTLFINNNVMSIILRNLLLLQYRIALRFAHTIFFQNPDDLEYFLARKILCKNKARLSNGSGIDLHEFGLYSNESRIKARRMLENELGQALETRIVILCSARAVREKGIYEFYKAARILSFNYPDRYIFIHLGLVDDMARGYLQGPILNQLAWESHVHYLGYKDNIQDYMLAADIVTLPSYREGVPRSLIEALALGKVIVTTDVPGCRETVIDGWNGYLCKPGDANSLANCIYKVTHEFCLQALSRSRQYCEEKFDADKLVTLTMKEYGLS